MVKRDSQTLISHWGNSGKIAAVRLHWDIKYLYVNNCHEIKKKKKRRSTSNILHTIQILSHAVLFIKASFLYIQTVKYWSNTYVDSHEKSILLRTPVPSSCLVLLTNRTSQEFYASAFLLPSCCLMTFCNNFWLKWSKQSNSGSNAYCRDQDSGHYNQANPLNSSLSY